MMRHSQNSRRKNRDFFYILLSSFVLFLSTACDKKSDSSRDFGWITDRITMTLQNGNHNFIEGQYIELERNLKDDETG